MPIKPENYPPNWKQISLAVREAAGNKCEFCGVQNHAIGARDRYGEWHDMSRIDGMSASEGDSLWDEYPNMIRIVLTVAHLDHNTFNNDRRNLKALCQKCHLTYDAKLHAKHAKVTRGKRRIERVAATGQLSFIDEVQP